MAIGVCLGTDQGRILEKRTWCLSPFPGQVMEECCLTEFWHDKSALLSRITAVAVPPLEGLASFNNWLIGLHARYPAVEFRLLSDNPAYDIGTLDHVLCSRGLRLLPIRALGDGAYRPISDPSEMIKGQGSRSILHSWVGAQADHDHWPENDAEHIYWRYIGACRVRDQLVAGTCLKDVRLEGQWLIHGFSRGTPGVGGIRRLRFSPPVIIVVCAMGIEKWAWPSGPKEIWGPKGWYWLHVVAINYPRRPTPEDARVTLHRIWNFVTNLPCAACRGHATRHVARTPPALTSSGAFQEWVWRFHNAVNARLGKRLVSYEEYLRLYAGELHWANSAP